MKYLPWRYFYCFLLCHVSVNIMESYSSDLHHLRLNNWRKSSYNFNVTWMASPAIIVRQHFTCSVNDEIVSWQLAYICCGFVTWVTVVIWNAFNTKYFYCICKHTGEYKLISVLTSPAVSITHRGVHYCLSKLNLLLVFDLTSIFTFSLTSFPWIIKRYPKKTKLQISVCSGTGSQV